MEIICRLANVEDAESLMILNEAFNGKGSNTLETIRERLQNNKTEMVFVVAFNDKVVGFCCAMHIKSICYSVSYVIISELFIDESYQRKNIGKKLMHYVEEWHRNLGAHDFQLFTGNDNTNAQMFYESIGYVRFDDILYRKKDSWKL